jgi:hypothetical protein
MAEGQVTQWEGTRSPEPVDFPSILFGKLAAMAATAPGSKDRHWQLQDLSDFLTAYQDDQFRHDLIVAANERARIVADATTRSDGGIFDVKEAVNVHQRLWLQAIMRLMKRRNMVGEDWVRG